jgi:hypothetical protein
LLLFTRERREYFQRGLRVPGASMRRSQYQPRMRVPGDGF